MRALLLPLLLSLLLVRSGQPSHEQRDADPSGPVRTWIWHFDSRLGEAAVPTYRDFLDALPDDVRVLVGVRSSADADLLRLHLDLLHQPDPRVGFLEIGREVSTWARDRYVVLSDRVLMPAADSVATGWLGDLSVGRSLGLRVVESGLVLEGGNLLFTRDRVLTGFATILDNMEHLQIGAEEVHERIQGVFGKGLVVVGEGTALAEEHVDMFLAVVGRRRLLLGDPRLALADLDDDSLARLGRFRLETQLEFSDDYDVIAQSLEARGFEVERIPILHAENGMILTWNNAVVEGRRAYVPDYGVDTLDAAAHAVWRGLGFDVRPVSAAGIIPHGGAVRCATNVVRTQTAGR